MNNMHAYAKEIHIHRCLKPVYVNNVYRLGPVCLIYPQAMVSVVIFRYRPHLVCCFVFARSDFRLPILLTFDPELFERFVI